MKTEKETKDKKLETGWRGECAGSDGVLLKIPTSLCSSFIVK